MRSKQQDSGFHVELADGGRLARRQTTLLPDGSYLFVDDLRVEGIITSNVITCAAWLLELYELTTGEHFFIRGTEHIRPRTKHFGVFYPPFSLARPCFKNATGRMTGIAATEILPTELTTVPIIFETTFNRTPSGAAEVIEILNAGENHQRIEMNPKPSLLSLKAKKLIDESYLVYPSIARISARLGVTHEHLSRQFKRDFKMSPSHYLRLLRVADAPLRLARGEEIINVSLDVGYNDLSRFYKQFRQTTNTSPGACKTIMRPHRNRHAARK